MLTAQQKKDLKIKKDAETEKLILDGIEKIVSSDEYQNFLELSMNMAHMSPNNKMNLTIQSMMREKPITFVKTAKSWSRDYERNVIKGEKAFYVQRPNMQRFTDKDKLESYMSKRTWFFSPKQIENAKAEIEEKGFVEILNGFKWIAEFDVSQTDGKELPAHSYMTNIDKSFEDFEKVKTMLTDYITAQGIQVYFKEKSEDPVLASAYGYFSPSANSITVCVTDRSQSDQIKTLVHEMAHSMLHGKELKVEGLSSDQITGSIKEVEAESVAFLVCKKIGIDSDCRSFGYLAGYLPNDAKKRQSEFNKCFGRIDRTATTIFEKALKEYDKVTNKLTELIEGYPEERPEMTDIDVPFDVDMDELISHLSMCGYDDYIDYSDIDNNILHVDADYSDWVQTIVDDRSNSDYEVDDYTTDRDEMYL